MSVPLISLAGGRATRLKDLSQDLPKFLMPLAEGETFADVHLSWAARQGFKDVILSIGWHGDKIQEYCGTGKKWNLNLFYVDDGKELRGTGGALKRCLEQQRWTRAAVTYGDTLLSIPCKEIVQRAEDLDAQVLMTVFKNTVPGHQCNADLKEGRVSYSKQNPQKAWQYIDYGFLVVSAAFVQSFPAQSPLDLATPLETLSLQRLVHGWEAHERFWEIGSPEALEEFRRRGLLRFGH